jgi:hypothetical protein
MKEALIVLNEMVAEGVISEYAIGGAIGASFYIEATNTEDVDVFVFMTPTPGGLILLDDIYASAKSKGATVEDEHLRIGNWLVQILPAADGLVSEALNHAVAVQYFDVPTRVMTPEYLCAIAMQTGRFKDYLRVAMFIEQKEVNLEKLTDLLVKYQLTERISKVSNWPSESPK